MKAKSSILEALETQGNYTSTMLTDDISFGAMIVFDHAPLGFLTYNIDCSLFEMAETAGHDHLR